MTLLPQIVVAAAALAIAGAALVLLRRGRERRERDPRAALAGLTVPALVSDRSGVVLARNDAMSGLAPGAPTVAALLRAVFGRCDEPALYRLARDAGSLGFALGPLEAPPDRSRGHLAVRLAGPGRLIWSVLPPDATPRVMHPDGSRTDDEAPFAHLRFVPDGGWSANRRLREIAGDRLDEAVARLASGDSLDDDRVILPAGPDGVAVLRHFSAIDPRTGARDVYLFPVPEDARTRQSPLHLMEAMPVALAQFEMSGTLVWCNARARAILGRAAVPGTALSDLIEPLARPVDALLQEAAAADSAAPVRGEMARLRRGETFLEIALSRIDLHRRATLFAVITDASEVRRLEDQFIQSQKMEAVGKLAGGVAHDFNNVLTAIIGHADLLLLKKEISDPDYADLMQIVQNANRAAALVRQLLAFSRKQTLKPVTLSVRDVISDAHYLLDRLVGETVRLDLGFGGDLWPVRADPQQLEQVLMNLVVNARDAMQGAGTITVSARNLTLGPGADSAHLPPGEYVEIAVHDSGPGIAPEILDKVFDPFFTTKGKGEGTGLGLSTVYGIVRQSGGHIRAANHPEGGAVICILLPRSAPAETVEHKGDAPPPRRDLTGSAAVMLVEDEAPVRAFAARALTLRGYRVTEAETAEDAMEILADPDHAVDLLISDVVMPGMSGPEFATEARRLRPGLRLVFVSGYAEESFRETLAGSDFLFLPKPFTLDELTAKVKEALGAAS